MTSPILLIWEEIPENTKLYLLTDLTEEQYAFIIKSNGGIINVADTDDAREVAINELAEFLQDKKPWYDFQEDGSDRLPGAIDKSVQIVIAGFAM